MNDAGRIGFVVKGDYSSTATYDFLDVVYYNGSSYVAKKLTVGNAPQENSEFWQVLVNQIWQPNTKTDNGYVLKGEGNANKVWTVDADGNPIWGDVALRRCIAFNDYSDVTSNPWHKICSCIMKSYGDYLITFKVNKNISSYSESEYGILTVHVRWIEDMIQSMSAIWEYCGLDIKSSDFVVTYNNNSTQPTVELWCKKSKQFHCFLFFIINEGTRLDITPVWTLYNSTNGVASLPEGYTVVESTLGTIQNTNIGNEVLYEKATNQPFSSPDIVPFSAHTFNVSAVYEGATSGPYPGYGYITLNSVVREDNAKYQLAMCSPNNLLYRNYINGKWNKWKECVLKNPKDDILEIICPNVEQRRNTFRGKNLGSAYTDDQKAQVRAGTFNDLFIGDYWVINGVTWRIVDINYWLNTGDTNCTTPHLVIMPDQKLYITKMNKTNITTGGYVGSQMYTANLANAKTLVNSAFGSANILNHREYLTNAVTNGYPSAGVWYDSTVELPNEIMMYGSLVFTPAGDGSFVPNRYTIDKTQLALMKMYPMFINPGRYWYWLRDVVSSAHFARVGTDGAADYYYASTSLGVRPVFGLIG